MRTLAVLFATTVALLTLGNAPPAQCQAYCGTRGCTSSVQCGAQCACAIAPGGSWGNCVSTVQ